MKSDKDGKRYIGMTLDLERRLKEHNKGKTKSTKYRAPFKIEYFEEYNSAKEARAREKFFKTSAGRKYFRKKNINIWARSSIGYPPDRTDS